MLLMQGAWAAECNLAEFIRGFGCSTERRCSRGAGRLYCRACATGGSGSRTSDYGPALCVLGLIDAALGRKEEALQEGRRALELTPIAKDSLDGADVLYFYAVICAWTGEPDLAIEQLETLAKIPAGASPTAIFV